MHVINSKIQLIIIFTTDRDFISQPLNYIFSNIIPGKINTSLTTEGEVIYPDNLRVHGEFAVRCVWLQITHWLGCTYV